LGVHASACALEASPFKNILKDGLLTSLTSNLTVNKYDDLGRSILGCWPERAIVIRASLWLPVSETNGLP
jgi:hypothetical protein